MPGISSNGKQTLIASDRPTASPLISATPIAPIPIAATNAEPEDRTNRKQEQILQGAMQVFLQHGFAGTSMDRVAIQAGVSKQTIYSHFQAKEGLFIALIERVTVRRIQTEMPDEAWEGKPTEVLQKLAESLLTKMDDPEYIAFLRLVIAESGRFPELAQLYSRTVIQYGYGRLGNYLKAHPELNIPDPEAMARIFLGSLVSFILAQEMLQGKRTMPMAQERLIASLLHCVLR